MEWLVQNKEWLFSGLLVALPLAIIGWLFARGVRTRIQRQRAGKGSTNIQVGGNIQAKSVSITQTQGITVSEARAIALDVFRSNFYSLAGEAVGIAGQRAEEITEKFLRELQQQNQEGLAQAQDPDFQYSLYTAQREYARMGDKELGDLLVDLLVDRTKHRSRSIIQIVLNESLVVAPKLTSDQLAALSVIFIFRYTINQGVNSLDSLKGYLDKYIQPFVHLLNKRDACYQHLEYSGCGAVGIGSLDISEVFRKNYPGIFSKGFGKDQLEQRGIGLTENSPVFTRCLHDSAKMQVNAMNEDVLRHKASELGVNPEDVNKLVGLSGEFLMSQNEVKVYLKELRPYMDTIIDVWSDSRMKNFTLTSVGIAIGHANVKKNLGEFTDLSIWIN